MNTNTVKCNVPAVKKAPKSLFSTFQDTRKRAVIISLMLEIYVEMKRSVLEYSNPE